jgi:tetratricopeptide (TPR) repeat protein
VVILRLKQCERALADGRLDEAFDLLRQPDIRSHRRGQDLVGDLVKALVDRGRKHLAQGRLTAAAMDAEKAVQIGGNLPDAVQLREAVHTAQNGQARVNQQAGQAIALARRHADQGQLTIGQQLLVESPVADPRLEDLKRDLAARREGLEASLKKATEAFDAGDWKAAIDHILMAGKNGTQDPALRRLADRIADHVATEAMPHLESGRLDAVATLLARLDRLPVGTAAARQLRTTLNQCAIASAAIAEGRQQEAEESLRRLQVMSPGAKWIGELVEQARQWGAVQTAMRTSPLSLLTLNGGLKNPKTPVLRYSEEPGHREKSGSSEYLRTGVVGSTLRSIVLHVDGVGSYLVLTGSPVSIGPRTSARALDLPLMIDASSQTISLSRSDEDYFLKADGPATVNEVPCVSRMLNNGDKIGIGTRCRMTFRRPSAASSTAVLDVSGARLPTAAIREIVIGPGGSAHIRSDDMSAPVVLVRCDDGLACRSAVEITIDGQRMGNGATLPTGVPISIGSLRLVISGEGKFGEETP